MRTSNNIFNRKHILIYGLGKSGISSLNYLKKRNFIKVYDDNNSVFDKHLVKYQVNKSYINKTNFDYILVSPGIDIKKCKIKFYLKKNIKKIITDFDVFYLENPKNLNITITGTNGKSTSCKLLHDILRKSKKDARLVGNIGNPILNEKNIKKNTIFVIEASSYQIEYSKFFKANYALILNISPDHLERHGNLRKYTKIKLKLFNNKKNNLNFCENNNKYYKYFDNKNIKTIKVNTNLSNQIKKKIKNKYFKSINNQKNLAFIIVLCKKLKLNMKNVFRSVNLFKQLKFRQQIIYNNKKILIINDSKSTSFSSSRYLLESYTNIYWIVGGLPKKNDKFTLNKKYFKNISLYIFGKNKNFFKKKFKNKLNYQSNNNLSDTFEQILADIKMKNSNKKSHIIFSPSAASFDQFKNFEHRGTYFNSIIKKNKKKLND